MGNFKNINSDEISTEFIPSYEELATFLSSDVENLIQNNFNNNVGNCNSCEVDNSYRVRIKLFGNCDCSNCLLNKLTLDNVGENYFYIDGSASLDNNKFNPDFNTSGVSTEVHSNSDSRLFKMSLSSINNQNNNCNCNQLDDYCSGNCETGFKLSQIMRNIGNIEKLDKCNRDGNADICIRQRVRVLNRCNRCYVIFNFNLLNNGNNTAQKILFKDVFPENIFMSNKSIFLNNNCINQGDINLRRNVLVLSLNDLKPREEVNITVVGLLFSLMRIDNFATISYVNNCFKDRNRLFLDISQKLSNVKSI